MDSSDLKKVCFLLASNAKKEEALDICLKYFSIEDSQNGDTILMEAVKSNNISMVEFLLNKGCNVNNPCGGGFTPLMCAVDNDNYEMTAFLLKHGADINAQDIFGRKALYFAERNENASITSLIFKHLKMNYLANNQGCYNREGVFVTGNL